MNTIRKSLLVGLFFSLLWLGVPFLTANAAAQIVIDDDLSGTLYFPGLPVENPDGSITYNGVTYLGTATGNISGYWAMVLVVKYPADSTTGNVMIGGWALGTRTDSIYGSVMGTIDPIAGDFNIEMSAIGGFGAYKGMAGTGYFQGTLSMSNAGVNIDGSLLLILVSSEAKAHGGFGKIDDRILSALILLGP